MRRITGLAVCLTVALLMSACAAKSVPAPAVTAAKFPDFIRPAVPARFADTRVALAFDRGWTFLQAGDLAEAEREFADALKAAPGFYPAEASLGYVALARNDDTAALAHFEQALTADASLTDVKRHVDVLKFQVLERGLSRARAAAGAGRLDEAITAYADAIRTSPDSPFLYRELAGVERKKGSAAAALDDFRRAVALDPVDAASMVQIGEILDEQRDYAGAARAYADALAVEPGVEVERRLEAVRARADLARLPAEYRAIERTAQLTRAELAALIGVRLGELLQDAARSAAAPITDIRGHWASVWMTAVANAGVMEPFSNHAFQPRTVVHRVDLAQAAARLLARAEKRRPGQLQTWEAARLTFADLPTSHLAYAAASMTVAAGAMRAAGDTFQPSRPVTGAEAIDAINRIATLSGLR